MLHASRQRRSTQECPPIGTTVITGASAGVGRALARVYGARGDGVALLARGEAGLAAAEAEVNGLGGKGLAVPTDVASADEVERAADEVEDRLGPIDLWINTAMVTVMAPAWDVAPDEYRRVTEVNYLGVVHGTLSALHRMRPRDRGVIVQVGSALSFRGIPAQAPYCATKHAVQGFTESLQADLLGEGSSVHVGMVHLPAVNTPQFTWSRNRLAKAPRPVAPIYSPEVVARAIAWSADHRRRETHVGASTFATVWADRLFGSAVGRYLARTGVDDQQTDEPASRWPDDNLDALLDAAEDRGSEGPFADEAKDSERFSVVSRHRGKALAAAVVAGGAALTAWRSGR